MSKIAEKKAKDIEKKLESSQAYKFDNFSVVCGAIEGYDQALQDFVDKACHWLESNLIDKEIVSIGIWHKFTDKDIEQFKNYMQNESEK